MTVRGAKRTLAKTAGFAVPAVDAKLLRRKQNPETLMDRCCRLSSTCLRRSPDIVRRSDGTPDDELVRKHNGTSCWTMAGDQRQQPAGRGLAHLGERHAHSGERGIRG